MERVDDSYLSIHVYCRAVGSLAPIIPKKLIKGTTSLEPSKKSTPVNGVGAGRYNVDGVLMYGQINSPYQIRVIIENAKMVMKIGK